MKQIIRGQIFDFLKNPADCNNKSECYRFLDDGALVIESGYIKEVVPFDNIKNRYNDYDLIDYSDYLVMPGFIDTHIHYPQMQIVGSYGKQLIDWLDNYTFKVEQNFNRYEYAQCIAELFVNEILRNGTTTCMVYATSGRISADAFFEIASKYNIRIIAGNVLMNRNAPDSICDTTEKACMDCEYLIGKWHNQGRNKYVLTPRFAITSDMEELNLVGLLHTKYPDTYIQTHLSENRDEIETTLKLFPECRDYLEVYENAGLLSDHSFFAHCVHLSNSEYERIQKAQSVIVHCPSSNLFLGSGLFNMRKACNYEIKVCIATDVGAGTSFSLLRTLSDAYKVQQINGYSMSSLESFYSITLGAARALKMEDKIGSFKPGNEADFVVLDYNVPQIQKIRMEYMKMQGQWDIENLLFGLQTMGDDRNIKATHVMGKQMTENR